MQILTSCTVDNLRADVYADIWWTGFGTGMLLAIVIVFFGWIVWSSAIIYVRSLVQCGTNIEEFYSPTAESDKAEAA